MPSINLKKGRINSNYKDLVEKEYQAMVKSLTEKMQSNELIRNSLERVCDKA